MGFGKLISITIAPRSEDRHYTDRMARTHTKVRFLPKGKQKHTEASAAKGVEEVLRILEGRWKLVILFHPFGGKVRRFSELRRAIPAVSEKMLIQQLRQLEQDDVVLRFVHHQVAPKVEYSLTEWGQALSPALDALLTWVELRESLRKRPSVAIATLRDEAPRAATPPIAKKVRQCQGLTSAE
jgi:DNA-binding HxlR family transcriptional regulator